MKDYKDFLELAKHAALKAGDLLLNKFEKTNEVKYKGDRDLVTEADWQAEELIISMIKKRYPDHRILAEESGKSGDKSDYMWIIDPLDGTNNFAYGIPLYGVSIAMMHGKQTVLGVINIPIFNELFYAQQGSGAYMNGQPVQVSKRKKLKEMLMFCHSDIMLKKKEIPASMVNSGSFFSIRMLGAATVHLSLIIKGRVDVWIEHRAKPWDIAAGCLIVEEAGGRVTDFNGNPWTPFSQKILVSNGKAHAQILKIIGKQA